MLTGIPVDDVSGGSGVGDRPSTGVEGQDGDGPDAPPTGNAAPGETPAGGETLRDEAAGDTPAGGETAGDTPAGDETAGDETAVGGRDGGAAGEGSAPSLRRPATWAATRAVVILAAAAVAYAVVVPQTVTVRSRLAQLVLTHPGVAAFEKTKPQSGQQDDTQTGLAAMTAAAKKSPGHTGLYSIEWAPSQTSAAGLIAFLLPTAAQAATTMGQIQAQQLAAGSYSSDGLSRAATFTVAGVPGLAGSDYRPVSKAAGAPPELSVTAFRLGSVVAVAEVAGGGGRADVSTIAHNEYDHLVSLGGFSLQVTRYPTGETIAWTAGAVVVAALVGLVPLERRRRARRRQLEWEAEMANRVQVGSRVITKRRV